MRAKVKQVSIIEYDVGDIVLSLTTDEFGIVVGANREENIYQIFFFRTEEIVPYDAECICSQSIFHIPINDISDIKRCYLDGDKAKSVSLTWKG